VAGGDAGTPIVVAEPRSRATEAYMALADSIAKTLVG